jgi:probable rRNA maturation factor
MNIVALGFRDIAEPAWLDSAESFARDILARLGKRDWELSILFCGDDFIRELNREYRDRDEATDVLSFSQGEEIVDADGRRRFLAGDIVISLDTLAKNAEYFAVERDEELKRLIIHGILHLGGLDHEDNDPSRPMLARQEELVAATAAARIS